MKKRRRGRHVPYYVMAEAKRAEYERIERLFGAVKTEAGK